MLEVRERLGMGRRANVWLFLCLRTRSASRAIKCGAMDFCTSNRLDEVQRSPMRARA
jgi:hypothetical protein